MVKSKLVLASYLEAGAWWVATPSPTPGLMGENLLGLPDSVLRRAYEPIGGSALVNLSCIKEGTEA